ncbi:MAG: hypothetical protein IKK02_03140, partial [Tidjanibacter sp.]|nr:hypothetical protein [Tidjanibacter sp.]MBR7102830.1 hypothetical protein [Tidjanibacter sp.]
SAYIWLLLNALQIYENVRYFQKFLEISIKSYLQTSSECTKKWGRVKKLLAVGKVKAIGSSVK